MPKRNYGVKKKFVDLIIFKFFSSTYTKSTSALIFHRANDKLISIVERLGVILREGVHFKTAVFHQKAMYFLSSLSTQNSSAAAVSQNMLNFIIIIFFFQRLFINASNVLRRHLRKLGQANFCRLLPRALPLDALNNQKSQLVHVVQQGGDSIEDGIVRHIVVFQEAFVLNKQKNFKIKNKKILVFYCTRY